MKRLTKRLQSGAADYAVNMATLTHPQRSAYRQKCVDRLTTYEDICFDEDGKERITVEELSALVKAREEGRDAKRCKRYVGVACVDGTCPMAAQDEYDERCMPVIRSCRECWLYRGCEDCDVADTDYCNNKTAPVMGREEET